MGAITVHNLDASVIAGIERRAAEKGVSVEEEVRLVLKSVYTGDGQASGQEWARRQLQRLRQGELPTSKIGSVEEIRRMRQERSEQLLSATGRHDERHR
jgi:plasmid stability protein